MKHALIAIAVSVLLVGCATSRTTSTTHTSEHYSSHSQSNSVYDSTLVDHLREVIRKNDTIYVHDSIVIIKWKDRYECERINDTIVITDTITNLVEVDRPILIDKPIPAFVRNSCIAFWGLLLVIVVVCIIRAKNTSLIGIFKKLFRK